MWDRKKQQTRVQNAYAKKDKSNSGVLDAAKRKNVINKSKYGLHLSRSDTDTVMMNIRAQQLSRNKRVKPSMPKMPWD